MDTTPKETNNRDSKIITIGHFAYITDLFKYIPWSEIQRVMPPKMRGDLLLYIWNKKLKKKSQGVLYSDVEKFLKEFYMSHSN